MRGATNGKGEILLVLTYPEFELLTQIVEFSASGDGCHRGAEYVNHQLCRIGCSEVINKAIHEVEKQEEKSEKKRDTEASS